MGKTTHGSKYEQSSMNSTLQNRSYCSKLSMSWSVFSAFLTGAVWRRAAPLAVQLTHSRCVADDCTLADAAVADDWANCPTVAWDLGVWWHAGTVTQHHCQRREMRERKWTSESIWIYRLGLLKWYNVYITVQWGTLNMCVTTTLTLCVHKKLQNSN